MEYFTSKTQLKRRCWTKALIKELLGGTEPPYPKDKVFQAEATDVFQNWKHSETNYYAKTLEVIAQNAQRVDQLLTDYPIVIARLPINELYKQAITSWEKRLRGTLTWEQALAKGKKPSDLDTITVNHLRHQIEQYSTLYQAFRDTGIGAKPSHHRLKDRMLREIARVYPELESACIQQLSDVKRYTQAKLRSQHDRQD